MDRKQVWEVPHWRNLGFWHSKNCKTLHGFSTPLFFWRHFWSPSVDKYTHCPVEVKVGPAEECICPFKIPPGNSFSAHFWRGVYNSARRRLRVRNQMSMMLTALNKPALKDLKGQIIRQGTLTGHTHCPLVHWISTVFLLLFFWGQFQFKASASLKE